MREQIVELNEHDDYHSARDRMNSAAADRVLLVWPTRKSRHTRVILDRKLDLLLLHRHASNMRSHLAVVTHDDTVVDNAAELGIPVFDSVKDSHLFLWNSRRSPRPDLRPKLRPLPRLEDARRYLGRSHSFWYHAPIWRYISGVLFTVPTFVAIGIMLLLTIPRAEVTINPAVQHITTQLQITADPQFNEINFTTKIIPARILEIVVNSQGETSTSGTVDLATQHAQGTVVFTNLSSQHLQLPAGTAVRTTGSLPVRFVTQHDVHLRDRNTTAIVLIHAFEPGPDSNVAIGLINDVEGSQGTSVAVTNPDPTTGGDVLRLPAVSRADRNQLYATVHEQIRQQAHHEVAADLESYEFAPISSAHVIEVTSSTFSNFVGEQTSLLTLEMRAKIAVTIVDERLSHEIGRHALEQSSGTQLVLLEDTLSYSHSMPSRGTTGDKVAFTLTARGTAGPAIDLLAVQQAVRWQDKSQASEILYNQFPVVTRPTVTLWPKWFRLMPWLTWRTQVNVQMDNKINGFGDADTGS